MTGSRPTIASNFSGSQIGTLLVAFAAALVFTVIFYFNGPANMAGDFLHSTDDMVRMVVVRDWLAGQDWYDPYLHRLGFELGTNMHWSRLVDAPIGLLVLTGDFFHAGYGERFAAVAWPFITFVATLAGILTTVRRATGSDNVIPTLVIGGFGLWSWGAFQTGVIDHHSIQTALGVWLVASIVPPQSGSRNFAIAGILTALMLAIGIESLPIAIAGAMAIIVRLAVERDVIYEPIRLFGLSLALTISVLFLLLIGPQNYGQTHCDSLSLFHLVCAGLGGIMLYAGLHPIVRIKLPAAYVTAPLISGVIVGLVALVFFPQCLGDPVANIDPLLRQYWLDSIMEAQNVFKVFELDPWLLLYQHALTVLALGALVWSLVKSEQTTLAIQLLIFLVITTAVTFFQMRGIQQSGAIAGLALSIAATRFLDGAGNSRPLASILVLVVCCNMFWQLVVRGGMALMQAAPGPLIAQSGINAQNICRTSVELEQLLTEKPGFIAAANGLGPWLLLNTSHRVLSGPYHRNGAGNLAAVKIMIGTEDEARKIMRNGGLTLFAACPKFVDERQILNEVPNGFLAQLLGGKKVDWLVPIESTMDMPLKLWRVRNP